MAESSGVLRPEPDAEHTMASTQLQAGALRLPGVLMQSVTAIAPAIAALFTVAPTAAQAGLATPLAYAGAFVIALMLGLVLAQLSRKMTSAGTYYTYVSRTLGGKAGFLVAWIYLLFYPVVVAQVGASNGDYLHGILKSEYGWNVPWWLFMGLLILIVGALAYRGIELSVGLLVVLGVIEIVIVAALGLWGFADPGPGGVTLSVFNPGNAPSTNGLVLGIVFAIFAISGWDAAAPLGEESEDPKRNIPRGVIGSILILGVFLVFMSWGQLTGWGVNRVSDLAGSENLPAFVLAKQYWGGGWVLALLAIINSALAVAIGCQNAATRIFFGMARSGVLPAALAKVHPRYRTPIGANAFQTGINIVLGIGLPLLIGVGKVYSVTGFMFTFALIPVYILANVGVYRLYSTTHRDEFSVFKHAIFPLFSSAALVYLGYKSLSPWPSSPNNWSPIIVIVWVVLGVAVLGTMLATGRSRWLANAGQAIAEVPETAEARAHHHAGI